MTNEERRITIACTNYAWQEKQQSLLELISQQLDELIAVMKKVNKPEPLAIIKKR